jgi:hypothetical protein
MASERTKAKPSAQGFDCVSLPITPGAKNHARLARDGDPEQSSIRLWWFVGAIVVGAIAVGIVIGRYL